MLGRRLNPHLYLKPRGGGSVLDKFVRGFNAAGRPIVLVDDPLMGIFVSNNVQGPGGYRLITTTGITLTQAAPTGAEARGVVNFDCDPMVFTGSGLEANQEALGANGFGGGREFAWLARVRPNSDAPNAIDADWGIFHGLCRRTAGTSEPDNGVYWYADKDNSQQWVCKAARSATRSSVVSSLAWDPLDTDYHWLGYHVKGDGETVVPYVDGAPLDPIESANVQPADALRGTFDMDLLGVATSNLDVDLDHLTFAWTVIP